MPTLPCSHPYSTSTLHVPDRERPTIPFTWRMSECSQFNVDVGLAAPGPASALNNLIDGSGRCLRITRSYHGSRSWKRPVGSSRLSPCQGSALHYFSSERRSSSLDVSFSLDTSAKVCRFRSKKQLFIQLYFQVFGELFARMSFIFFKKLLLLFFLCFKAVYLRNFACTCNAEPCVFILRKKVQVMNVSLALL